MLLILLGPIWTGCGNDKPFPTIPTAPTTPRPVPVQTVSRIAISGNLMLTRIGESTQLTVAAILSDNTTKDVTSDGRWTSNDVRVVTLSPTGLLTVVGFGATSVVFSYQPFGASAMVTATPAGTFVISGRVREPGGGGLENVRVVDTMSGRSATTDSGGQFSLGELPQLHAHFRAEREGYEPSEVDATQANVDLPLQRIVRLVAGETVTPAALAPNDLSYTADGHRCNDCRLIRVVVPQAGTLNVRVTWTGVSNLSLFADGRVVAGATRELTAEVPVNAPREVVVYLGAAPPNGVSGHTPFTFETSLR